MMKVKNATPFISTLVISTLIILLSHGAHSQDTTPVPAAPGVSQFYLQIPANQFFSACIPSNTTLFSYLVNVYGQSDPNLPKTLNQSIPFEELPQTAQQLKNFTVAVIIKPKYKPNTVLKADDLLKAQYDKDLSCIDQPTGCMARTTALQATEYCMIAANPSKESVTVYLGCTQAKYDVTEDIKLEQDKLRAGAPKPSSGGDPYIPPIGFVPAEPTRGGAKGDGSNLASLYGNAEPENGTSENEEPENNTTSDNKDGASQVHFGSTSFLFVLLTTFVFVI